jgi:flavin-dependent dehydrogenase
MKGLTILGAGLSGLTSAINLARGGYDVDVYEKNKDVGTRFRGDLQGLENWSARKDILEKLREMNIEVDFDCDPFSRVTLTNRSRTKEIVFQRPLFYLVKRGSFSGTIDHGLKTQALELGINIHFEETRSPNEVDIVATGPILEEVPAVVKGIVFKTDVKDAAIVLCNDEFAFKGYSYLLITKGYGCLCTVVTVDELYRVNRCFEKTKAFFARRIGLNMQSPKEVGGVGSFSPKSVYKKGTTLYVGEAAGLQDLLWGFGMRFAVTSGYLAAQSIINNEDYEQIAKKHFENKLKASLVNRYLWEEVASKNDYSLLIYLAEFVKKILHSMHNYNLLQRVAYPMASYHLKKKYPKLKL